MSAAFDHNFEGSQSAGGPHDERLSWDGPYMAPAAVDAVIVMNEVEVLNARIAAKDKTLLAIAEALHTEPAESLKLKIAHILLGQQ